MFQDVDVKIQVRSYLNFDVGVSKHALFPWIITNVVHVECQYLRVDALYDMSWFRDVDVKFRNILYDVNVLKNAYGSS